MSRDGLEGMSIVESSLRREAVLLSNIECIWIAAKKRRGHRFLLPNNV